MTGLGWTGAEIDELATQNPPPSYQEMLAVATHFTHDQAWDVIEAGEITWPDVEALANAAAPGVASPALVLQAAVNACHQLIADDIQALGAIGVVVHPERYGALIVGTDSLAGMPTHVVRDYMTDARWFSICFDTARLLLDDLGTGAMVYSSGGATNAVYPLIQQQARSAQLVLDLQAAAVAPGPVIFNIHVGGHGFTLTVVGGTVYQLEAFASQASPPHENPNVLLQRGDLRMSLRTSIFGNHNYPLATIVTAIGQMTANNTVSRATGATTMGWNAGPCGFIGGGHITDPMAIWWRAENLVDNADMVVSIARRIQARRTDIRAKLGL